MKQTWENKYLAIPFCDGGRDFKSVDCWGLIRLIYQTELQIELPNYAEISAKEMIKIAKEIQSGKKDETWIPVESSKLKAFDVVVMTAYGRGIETHVGIITSIGWVLHTEAGSNTVIVRRDSLMIRERIKCFRRHKALH